MIRTKKLHLYAANHWGEWAFIATFDSRKKLADYLEKMGGYASYSVLED